LGVRGNSGSSFSLSLASCEPGNQSGLVTPTAGHTKAVRDVAAKRTCTNCGANVFASDTQCMDCGAKLAGPHLATRPAGQSKDGFRRRWVFMLTATVGALGLLTFLIYHWGKPSLYDAVNTRDTRAVKVLLERDVSADVNVRGEKGRTLLHLAAFGGDPEIAQLLLHAGADVDARDGDSRTPLHCAALAGETDTAKVLLDGGADVNARDGGNMTPLHWAATQWHAQTAKVLLDAGADVNARDGRNRTPLHWAAQVGETDTAKVLLGGGANVNARDTVGGTPLDIAVFFGHTETAGLLRDHGGIN